MQFIVSNFNFMGTNIGKGNKAVGSGFKDLAYLEPAADPSKRDFVYHSE